MKIYRTTVYIDAANIALSAENLGFNLDIFKLFKYLKDKYRTEKIMYFTGNFQSKKVIFQEIEKSGIEIVYKEIYNENNKTKANCDVEISHRITFDIDFDLMDQIVLLSGDGDFVHVLDFAKKQNKQVKVFAFDPKSCSRMIKKREWTRLSFLVELGEILKINKNSNNEKPPQST